MADSEEIGGSTRSVIGLTELVPVVDGARDLLFPALDQLRASLAGALATAGCTAESAEKISNLAVLSEAVAEYTHAYARVAREIVELGPGQRQPIDAGKALHTLAELWTDSDSECRLEVVPAEASVPCLADVDRLALGLRSLLRSMPVEEGRWLRASVATDRGRVRFDLEVQPGAGRGGRATGKDPNVCRHPPDTSATASATQTFGREILIELGARVVAGSSANRTQWFEVSLPLAATATE